MLRVRFSPGFLRPADGLQIDRWRGVAVLVQNRSELEVDHAETAIGSAVGEIPRFGIIMAHAIALQLREDGLLLFFRDSLHARTAVARDEIELFRLCMKDPRHKIATLLFKMLQHPTFVLEALSGVLSKEGLVNLAVERKPDDGSLGMFCFFHGEVEENPFSAQVQQGLRDLSKRAKTFFVALPIRLCCQSSVLMAENGKTPGTFGWHNATQFTGALNDNLFKLLIIYGLAVAWPDHWQSREFHGRTVDHGDPSAEDLVSGLATLH